MRARSLLQSWTLARGSLSIINYPQKTHKYVRGAFLRNGKKSYIHVGLWTGVGVWSYNTTSLRIFSLCVYWNKYKNPLNGLFEVIQKRIYFSCVIGQDHVNGIYVSASRVNISSIASNIDQTHVTYFIAYLDLIRIQIASQLHTLMRTRIMTTKSIGYKSLRLRCDCLSRLSSPIKQATVFLVFCISYPLCLMRMMCPNIATSQRVAFL